MDILMWARHGVSALLLWVSGSLRRLQSHRANRGLLLQISEQKLLKSRKGPMLAIQSSEVFKKRRNGSRTKGCWKVG